MIDFKINEIGDIDIKEAYQYPSFLIQYHVPRAGKKELNGKIIESRYHSFRIDFDTDIKAYAHIKDTAFMIQFRTQHQHISPGYSINTVPIYDKEELAQEITIRLKTEYGEFEFLKEFGSFLSTLRHEDIKADHTHELMKQYTEEAIRDIDLANEYNVNTHWVEDKESRYRHERLKITIDTDENTIYEATI